MKVSKRHSAYSSHFFAHVENAPFYDFEIIIILVSRSLRLRPYTPTHPPPRHTHTVGDRQTSIRDKIGIQLFEEVSGPRNEIVVAGLHLGVLDHVDEDDLQHSFSTK